MERNIIMSYGLLMMMIMVSSVQGNEYEYDDPLSFSYYHGSCPQLDRIVHNKVTQWLKNDSTLAPALIRLHFHDCTVRVRNPFFVTSRGGNRNEIFDFSAPFLLTIFFFSNSENPQFWISICSYCFFVGIGIYIYICI